MAAKLEVRDDRRYTEDHEWAKAEGAEVRVGVTAFAVDQLGDVTLVTIDVPVGGRVEKGQIFGTIESVKTLSDLFAPVSGTLQAINEALADKPELVNDDCYGAGWMVAITADGPLDGLLDAAAYSSHVQSAAH